MKLLLIYLLCSCSSSSSKLEPAMSAKVIGVIDGDTFEVLHNGKSLRVRLAHIDCPEIRNNQPFGRAAKSFSSQLCFGKQVTISSDKLYDRYGRLIAEIIVEGNVNVNMELVKAGLAWHFKRYSTDTVYHNLELQARKAKLGLWKEESPKAPWEWRYKKQHPDSLFKRTKRKIPTSTVPILND